MEELIKIKCPQCGKVLFVRPVADIERKKVTCPACAYKGLFTDFKTNVPSVPVDEVPTEYPTEIPQHGEDNTGDRQYDDNSESSSEENTELLDRPSHKSSIYKLCDTDSGKTYQLRAGRNVIGRVGEKSRAHIQIDLGEKRSTSREHIVIDVEGSVKGGFRYYLSLYKPDLNSTFLNDRQLSYDSDRQILNKGDLIRLPDVSFTIIE